MAMEERLSLTNDLGRPCSGYCGSLSYCGTGCKCSTTRGERLDLQMNQADNAVVTAVPYPIAVWDANAVQPEGKTRPNK